MNPADPVASAAGPASEPSRLLRLAAALAVALAVALRVLFLGDKPFWSDEAWVAYLAGLPPGELLATVGKTTSPVGFVLAVKLCALLPGVPPEFALRLVPLAAGIATVVLLPRLVRALGGSPRAATLAVLVAATMPALVHYSRELKPYAIDALVATAFPLAALMALAPDGAGGAPPRRRAARYLPAGLALAIPLFSYGGVFVVAATIAWGWARVLRRRLVEARLPWAAATVVFAAVAAAAAVAVVREQAANPELARAFRPGSPGGVISPTAVAGRLQQLALVSARHLFPGAAAAGLAAAGFGLLAWPRAGRAAALAVAGGSAVLAAGAAAAGLYAVNHARLVLFAAPFVVAAAAVGADRALGLAARGPRARGAATALALLAAGSLAAFWTARDLSHRLHPERSRFKTSFLYDGLHDVPSLVGETLRRRQAGEPAGISHTITWSARYYARGRLDDLRPLRSRSPEDFQASVEGWLPSVPARGWLLLRDDLVSPALRAAVEERGFAIARETPFRGVALWELRRMVGDGRPGGRGGV